MMGYIGDPESTAKAFTSDGFLQSGDTGYISDVRTFYHHFVFSLLKGFTCVFFFCYRKDSFM